MPTVDELAADLESFKQTVPTLEEQLFSVVIPGWNNGADRLASANAMTLLVAPIPLRVLSVGVSWDYWNLPASDTKYWEGKLDKGSASTSWTEIARKTTQNTGAYAGGAVTARAAWTFDSANWGNADLLSGQLLRLVWTPYGTPSDLDMPFTVTVRYRAL
jgi:hypothetical protein